jgi:small subunit ribosomal protein S20
MANIKSSKKRILTNEKSRQRNIAIRSKLKTFMKRAQTAIASKNADDINAALPDTLREIDRAAQKGILHKRNAARKKSDLQHQAAKAING